MGLSLSRSDASRDGSSAERARWAGFGLLAALLLALVVYWETLASVARTWRDVETFRHGFVIVPIALVLIWQKREALFAERFQPSVLGVILVGLCSSLWFIAHMTGVLVVMQLAAVAVFSAAVVALLGTKASAVIAFPLAFVLLAVPAGEFLVPYLIDFTASFSVSVLHLLGIPVFRDGSHFYIPTGSYEVEKACSGVKYVIATGVFSALFSYFMFSRASKAVAFVVFALVLAMLANAVRATAVILLLHYTDLDIAAGEDHEFVGWIVYGLLIVGLAWLGNRFQDSDSPREGDSPSSENRPHGAIPRGRQPAAVAATLLCVVAGPALAALLPFPEPADTVRGGLPAGADKWVTAAVQPEDWHPQHYGFANRAIGRYRHASGDVDVALFQYLSQRQGAEVSNEANTVADTDVWTLRDVRRIDVELADASRLAVNSATGDRDSRQRMFWYWTQVADRHTVTGAHTKTLELLGLLSGKRNVSAMVVLSTPVTAGPDEAGALLNLFLSSYYERLRRCAGSVSATPDCAFGNAATEAL